MATTTTKTAVPPPPPSAVAERFPEAVAFARELRALFGDVRLVWARNSAGDELGRRAGAAALPAWLVLELADPPGASRDAWIARCRFDRFRRSSPGAPAP